MPPRFGRLRGWELRREQLAWAAGFVDGEGSFHLDRKGFRKGQRRHPHPRFEVGQAEPKILRRFRQAVGFANPVNGPYGNTKKDAKRPAKPTWVYGVSGHEHVQALLALLWPWLGQTKRQQAKVALKRYSEWDSART